MKAVIFWLVLIVGFVALLGVYMTSMPGQSFPGAPPALGEDEKEVSAQLRKHVELIARDIGTRDAKNTSAMSECANYLEHELRRSGLEVEIQEFGASRNLIAEVPGTHKRDEILVLGAHYDSVKRSPGADDNASGCAVLLETARVLAQCGLDRTLRFVFFADGQAPYLGTEGCGSRAYSKRCKERGEKIMGMLSLDSLGCFKDKPGTQSCPFPLSIAYPDAGNFVAFVGDFGSRDLVRQSVELFRAGTPLASEGAAWPSWFPGIAASDHASFRVDGYRAILVTDTGEMRNENYHKLSDTTDRLDYDRMARVVAGLVRVVSGLGRKSLSLQ